MALVPSKCTMTPRNESQNPSAPHLVSLKPSPAPLKPTPMEPSAPLTPIYLSLLPLNLTSMGPNTPQTQSVGPNTPLTPICEVQTPI